MRVRQRSRARKEEFQRRSNAFRPLDTNVKTNTAPMAGRAALGGLGGDPISSFVPGLLFFAGGEEEGERQGKGHKSPSDRGERSCGDGCRWGLPTGPPFYSNPPPPQQQPPAPHGSLPPRSPALCTQVPRERGSLQTGGNGGFIYGRSCHPSPSAAPWPLRFASLCSIYFLFLFFTPPSSLLFPFRAGDAGSANPHLQPRSLQGSPHEVWDALCCQGEFGPKVKGEGAAIGLSRRQPPLYAVYSFVNN